MCCRARTSKYLDHTSLPGILYRCGLMRLLTRTVPRALFDDRGETLAFFRTGVLQDTLFDLENGGTEPLDDSDLNEDVAKLR